MEKLYTTEEVAEILKVSPRTIRREREDANLNFIRIRGQIRYREVDIKKYLEENSWDVAGSVEFHAKNHILTDRSFVKDLRHDLTAITEASLSLCSHTYSLGGNLKLYIKMQMSAMPHPESSRSVVSGFLPRANPKEATFCG